MRHLVLLGLGCAHRNLLANLRQHQPADVAVTLLTRQRNWINHPTLLRHVALRQPMEVALEDVAQLAQQSRVRWVAQSVSAVEAAQHRLRLDDGRLLQYDWLSVEAEPVQPRDELERLLPGARENGLFAHPMEDFAKLWPRVQAMADAQALHFAVISGNANAATEPAALEVPNEAPRESWDSRSLQTRWETIRALEWAFALRHAWPQAAITWVSGAQPLDWAAWGSSDLAQVIRTALKAANITLLSDNASGVAPGDLQLATGARLACDVPIVVGPTLAPPWLAASDLPLDSTGHAAATHGFNRVLTAHPHRPDASQSLIADLRRILRGQTVGTTRSNARPRRTIITTGPYSALAEAWGTVWGTTWAGGRFAHAVFKH